MRFHIWLRGGGEVAINVPDELTESTVRYLEEAVEGTSTHGTLNWGDKPSERTSIATDQIVAFTSAGTESQRDKLLEEYNAILRKAVASLDSGEEWRDVT